MFYQEKQIQILLAKLLETDASHTKLINQLIYGKSMIHLNIFSKREEQIVLYLHQNNPQILISLTPKGQPKPFDIRRIKMRRDNYHFEDIYNLKDKYYIILEEQYEQVILLFASQDQREQFKRNMKLVARYIADFPTDLDSTIVKNFIKADKNKNLQLSQDQLFHLLSEIKLCDQQQIRDLKNYIKASWNSGGLLGFRQFENIARILACRRQLIPIFERYTKIKLTEHHALFEKSMKYSDFQSFLKSQQQQSPENVKKTCDLFFLNDKSRISFYEFCQFITGPLNNAVDSNYDNYQTPLDHPLFQYYCYSSHNTYLTGNQLTSDSKAERYHEDLLDGIRCVQIDCHDGAQGPIVKHGYTVTSSVTFRQVIIEMQKFRDKYPKHTPIIISLQNHCNSSNQYKMAETLQQIFGKDIISICEYQLSSQGIGKIIIKGSGNFLTYKQALSKQDKNNIAILDSIQDLQEESQEQNGQKFNQSDLMDVSEAEKVVQQEIDEGKFRKQKQKFIDKLELLEKRKQNFDSFRGPIIQFVKLHLSYKTVQKSKQVINLKLLTLTSMLGSGSIGKPSPWQSISISEKVVLNHHYNNTQDIIKKHTQNCWVRVYPKGTRFDSSNYNPLPAMQLGAQIIALNTQVADHPNYLIHRFFDKGKNRSHGYCLKPDLMNIPQKYNTIKITPLSAMKIYYNDPQMRNQVPVCQIKMKFYGLSKDLKLNKEEKFWRSYTEVKKDNGFNPIFQRTHTMIVRYHSKQLSFVMMEIEGCGVAVLPLGYLRKGVRSVTLCDDELKPKDSKIICQIQN